MDTELNKDNLCIIIRSVDERTARSCDKLLEIGFGIKPIIVEKIYPFSDALKEAYKVAFEQNRYWTLMLDGDVLPSAKQIKKVFDWVIRKDNYKLFQVTAKVVDKFFGGPRSAGFRIYKTSYLENAINLIPTEDISLRPETYTIKEIQKLHGCFSLESDVVIGLHDFEQFYADIFRTGIAHYHKHNQHLKIFLKCWQKKAKDDYDFQVFLKGVQYAQNVKSSDAFNKDVINKILIESGITLNEKKKDLTIDEAWVDFKIKHLKETKCFKRFNRIQKLKKIKNFLKFRKNA
jgi:hypothetical protein